MRMKVGIMLKNVMCSNTSQGTYLSNIRIRELPFCQLFNWFALSFSFIVNFNVRNQHDIRVIYMTVVSWSYVVLQQSASPVFLCFLMSTLMLCVNLSLKTK